MVKAKEAKITIEETKKRLYSKLEQEYKPNEIGLTKMIIPRKQSCSLDMLATGHPKAFVEFFELTHGAEDPEMSKLDINDMPMPPAEKHAKIEATLDPLRAAFIDSELATRASNWDRLFNARLQMAKVLEISGELNKAIYCYAKCHTVVEKFSKRNNHLCEIQHNLGKVYERLADIPKATSCYEDYFKLATGGKSSADIVNAASNLLNMYNKYAEKIRAEKPVECIEFLEKASTMAVTCGNQKALGEAKYKIGLLYERLKQYDKALEYQSEYLKICSGTNDVKGKSKAYEALATSHEALDDNRTATAHMEKSLEFAESTNPDTEARASCKLGMLYSRHKQSDQAVEQFEKFYKMACELKNIRLIDHAKFNLGVARGALQPSLKPIQKI